MSVITVHFLVLMCPHHEAVRKIDINESPCQKTQDKGQVETLWTMTLSKLQQILPSYQIKMHQYNDFVNTYYTFDKLDLNLQCQTEAFTSPGKLNTDINQYTVDQNT